jgi:V8-like Glu-specific endopeptidase
MNYRKSRRYTDKSIECFCGRVGGRAQHAVPLRWLVMTWWWMGGKRLSGPKNGQGLVANLDSLSQVIGAKPEEKREMLLKHHYLSYVCTSVIAATIAAGVLQQVSAQTTSIENRESAKELSSAEVRQLLRQVQPMPFYDEASDPDARPSYLEDSEENVGIPGSAPGGRARAARAGSGRESSSETADEVENETNFGTQNEGDFYAARLEQWLQTRYPWSAVGKLLIATTTPDVFNGSCSASVISPNNIIVTAAHCCYNRSTPVGFFKDWRFIPGLHDSSQPFLTYDWASTRVLTAWIAGGGRQNDVCVIRLLPNALGQGVSSRTGWLGRSWDQPQTEHVFTYGYPSNVEGGVRQAVCASENYPNCGSSLVNATGCNKTFGDSGAPWIRTYRPQQAGAMNFVNSVTSGHDACTGTFGLSYNGARFTTSNIVALCTAHGC